MYKTEEVWAGAFYYLVRWENKVYEKNSCRNKYKCFKQMQRLKPVTEVFFVGFHLSNAPIYQYNFVLQYYKCFSKYKRSWSFLCLK